jgi:hypothetical protein
LPRSPEPRVLAEDVREILTRLIDPANPDSGEAVQRFAERADQSTRTIYRVLSGQAGTSTEPASLALRVADQLVTAAGRHLGECRVLTAEGRVVPYLEAP